MVDALQVEFRIDEHIEFRMECERALDVLAQIGQHIQAVERSALSKSDTQFSLWHWQLLRSI